MTPDLYIESMVLFRDVGRLRAVLEGFAKETTVVLTTVAASSGLSCGYSYYLQASETQVLFQHLRDQISEHCRRLTEILGTEITLDNIGAWYEKE